MGGVLLFVYVLAGIAVYLVTTEQVSALENTLESHLPFNAMAFRSTLFIAIVLLFPVWLLLMNRLPYRQGPM
jgi:hypothetical protein